MTYAPGAPDSDEAERQKKEQELNMIVRQLMTSEAWARLRRVELVKPALARNAKIYLLQLYSAGKLNRRLSDLELKTLLARLSQGDKRDFTIRVV